MVKVYAILLIVGFLAVLVLVMGGSLFENLGRSDRDPTGRVGLAGKTALGSTLGFAMGGMAAEFSPLDLTWQVSLGVAILAGGISALWVRYASKITPSH